METPYPIALAGLVAALLTYCDLDTVFDAPPHALAWGAWLRLRAWWWGFILANAVLAGLLFYALHGKDFLKDLDPWLGGFLTGAGYTALVRLKFTTLPNNTPFGIEAFYEGLKNLVHKRINRIIREWRMQQSEALAQADIAVLRQRALLMVGSDALLSEEQRNSTRTWIEQTATHAGTPEPDRRLILALYIITEQKTSPPSSFKRNRPT